jgi:hypothetical protein
VKVGQLVNKLPSKRLGKADPGLIDSETLLGVEVEVEGAVKLPTPSDADFAYWAVHEDNSLRDNGREFVFNEPLFGADVTQACRYLCTQAKELKYKISERTGLHVHMDVRSMDLDKFRSLLVIYALMEKMLYTWVGDGRERNIHCLPWYIADLDLDNAAEIFRGQDNPERAQLIIKNLHRYAGLNLASLAKFGTIEYRHLKTTFDFERIVTWINMILSIKRAASIWEGTPEQLLKEARILGSYGFTHRVFGTSLTSKLWYKDADVDFREYGMPTAQYLLSITSKGEKLSDTEIYKKFEAAISTSGDEYGTCEGLERWKKANPQRKVDPVELVKKAKLNPSAAMQAGWTNQVAQQFQAQPIFLSPWGSGSATTLGTGNANAPLQVVDHPEPEENIELFDDSEEGEQD